MYSLVDDPVAKKFARGARRFAVHAMVSAQGLAVRCRVREAIICFRVVSSPSGCRSLISMRWM